MAGQNQGGLCFCSPDAETQHCKDCGEIFHGVDFDSAEGEAVDTWLHEFLRSERGRQGIGGFTSENIEMAPKRMRECAPGIDGVFKRWAFPLRKACFQLFC